MKWLPTWLAKAYAMIYTENQESWFNFEEAKAILHVEDKSVLSLRLKRLEESGFLISKRDSIDRRKKYFKLVEPKDAVFAFGIQPSGSSDVMGRLTAASKYLDFVIGGSYAAYVHSGYATPGKMDIYVKREDVGKWIALLSDKFTSVSVDDMLSEKLAKQNIHIHSSLTQEMITDSVTLDGIRYHKPENLVIDGLREQTEFALTDAFAILIKKRKEVDFNKLLKLAKYENLEKELGACMEIINSESRKKIFDEKILRKIRSGLDLSRKRFFPRNKTEESIEYKEISDKWGLRIALPRALILKIITDMVR